ncbi:hypothetical protein PR001_g14290 [Phytophthora rubi]|uniref:Secreted protein n=1 Tax=Phytophthora rubi TaxID=129364 RepID=A0A6A3KZF7_9STRA|nr:hypothetical protein PR002_g14722 [Phytophthora rubi]KAE9017858.1 hypothetical protein PR001_g14290 [Phytophthora rubi]
MCLLYFLVLLGASDRQRHRAEDTRALRRLSQFDTLTALERWSATRAALAGLECCYYRPVSGARSLLLLLIMRLAAGPRSIPSGPAAARPSGKASQYHH